MSHGKARTLFTLPGGVFDIDLVAYVINSSVTANITVCLSDDYSLDVCKGKRTERRAFPKKSSGGNQLTGFASNDGLCIFSREGFFE